MPRGGGSRIRMHASPYPRPLRQVMLSGDGFPRWHLQRDRLLWIPDVRIAGVAQHHEDVQRRGPRRHGGHRGTHTQDGRHLPSPRTMRKVRAIL